MNAAKFCALILGLALLLPDQNGFTQESHTLEVEVTDALPGEGQIFLSVFDDPESFLKTPLIELTEQVGIEGSAMFQINNLEPGNYAISAVYDINSNGELDTGLFGIPSEPVGFSNNVRAMLGPPKFHKASFILTGNTKINILLEKVEN